MATCFLLPFLRLCARRCALPASALFLFAPPALADAPAGDEHATLISVLLWMLVITSLAIVGLTFAALRYRRALRHLRQIQRQSREALETQQKTDVLNRTLLLAVEQSPTSIVVTDLRARIEYVNHCFGQFQQALAETGADPACITLEITENLLLEDLNEVIARMEELTALGVHFSIDDFGTGYSSLSYLKRLPISEMKIDRSFVRNAPNDPGDAALVETIVSVANHMRLRTIAEGVETAAQADFMRRWPQVIQQGFLYGRPEPAEDWLARWRKFHLGAGAAQPLPPN